MSDVMKKTRTNNYCITIYPGYMGHVGPSDNIIIIITRPYDIY